MTLSTMTSTIPLQISLDGVIRIGETRVTLDTVVGAFHDGATAEEIAQQYPTLKLADVYLVLGHYLDHRAEVDAYLRQRQVAAGQIRVETEARFDPQGVRVRLLARRGE